MLDSLEITLLKEAILPQGFVWIQASGGNVSFKENDLIYIKPSGISIEEFSNEKVAIFSRQRFLNSFKKIDPLNSDAERDYSEAIKQSQCNKESISLRPSMEAGFHALLGKKYVIHVHSIAVILLCHLRGTDEQTINDWLSKTTDKKIAFIPKVVPGFRLTKAIENNPESDWYFLENHGLIINTDDPLEVEIVKEFEKNFLREFDFKNVLYFYENPLKINELLDAEFPWAPIFPDSFVFMDKLLSMVEPADKLGLYKIKNLKENDKLFELWAAMILINQAASDLGLWTQEEYALITNMPTEVYRKSLLR